MRAAQGNGWRTRDEATISAACRVHSWLRCKVHVCPFTAHTHTHTDTPLLLPTPTPAPAGVLLLMLLECFRCFIAQRCLSVPALPLCRIDPIPNMLSLSHSHSLSLSHSTLQVQRSLRNNFQLPCTSPYYSYYQ